jgi:hypothetical protein
MDQSYSICTEDRINFSLEDRLASCGVRARREEFDDLVFQPIHNQVRRLAYWPFASALHMSLSSDFGMFT